MVKVIISDDEWNLSLARLEKMPPTLRIGILGKQFSRNDLMAEVRDRSRYGETFVLMQMQYLQFLARR